MGLRNCCCGCSLRTGTLIIGWVYLILHISSFGVLIRDAAYSGNEKIDFSVEENVVEMTDSPIFFQKEEIDPPVDEVTAVDVKIEITDGEPSDLDSATLMKVLNSDTDADSDFDVDSHNFFWFKIDDKMDSEIEEDPHDDLWPFKIDDEMDSKLDDMFSKMNEDFFKLEEKLSRHDEETFSSAFNDSKIGNDGSVDMSRWLTLDNLFKIRNKRDVDVMDETNTKRKIDSTALVLNAVTFSITIFCALLLIVGASKGYRKLFIPWMINAVCLMYTDLKWIVFQITKSDNWEFSLVTVTIHMILMALDLYMLRVVYSHYQELKGQGNKEHNLKFFTNNKPWTTSTETILPVISEKEKECV